MATYNQAGLVYNQAGTPYNISDVTISPLVLELTASIQSPVFRREPTTYNEDVYTYNQGGVPYNGFNSIVVSPSVFAINATATNTNISISCRVSVDTAQILASIQSVLVNTESSITITPDALSLILSAQDSTIRIDETISVEAALVTSSVPAPSISTIRNVEVTTEVASLILSALEVGISAVENLNFSITPQMVIREQKGNGIVKDTILRGHAIPARIIAVSNKTKALFEDNGLTYNESGYTFNDSRATYGGSDRVQDEFSAYIDVLDIKPVFIT